MSVSLLKVTSFLKRNCSYVLFGSPSSATAGICIPIQFSAPLHLTSKNDAAEGKKAKLSASAFKMKDYATEKDPHKLVTYCCGSNYFQTGEDVKIKPDSEYPEWLYTVDIGRSKSLDELDPNTKEYWEKVRLLARQRKNKLLRLRHKVLKQFR